MKRKLKMVAESWQGCQRCGLGNERVGARIVFGAGSSSAKYLLLYDVPTETDAALGVPMSGREGDILAELLEHAGIAIRDVYCTALLGCRPVHQVPETADKPAHIADRAPSKEELGACRTRLEEIIYQVDPMVIFAFGDLAWKSLIKPKARQQFTTVSNAIGELFTARIPGRWLKEVTYDVMPLVSMRQIMAQPSFSAHGPVATNVKHLQRARVYAEFLEKAGERDAAAAGFNTR